MYYFVVVSVVGVFMCVCVLAFVDWNIFSFIPMTEANALLKLKLLIKSSEMFANGTRARNEMNRVKLL